MDGVGSVDAKGGVLQVVGKAPGLGGEEGGRVRKFPLFCRARPKFFGGFDKNVETRHLAGS